MRKRELIQLNSLHHTDISSDIDKTEPRDYTIASDVDGLESHMRSADDVIYPEKDTLLKYCVGASVVLHLILFAAVSRVPELAPTKAFLRPNEKVSQVRLVEQDHKETKPVVPPENATAVSDRDHVALRERVPKQPPSQASAPGKVEPVDKRIAALIPPHAPEDLAPPNEEKKAREEKTKIPLDEKPASHNKPRAKPPVESRQKQSDPSQRKLDLKPTQQEQDIAAGLASPGGPTDFFPDGDLEEAVVDINTREEKFFSYLMHLKRKIQGVWVYPSSAANLGLGGTLTVEFSVARDGGLLYVNLLDSSGHSILDESAVKAIQNAAPYFPFPPRMRAKRLKIRANFIYITGNYFRRIM